MPAGDHWESYRDAERRVPGLIASMVAAVKKYVDEKCEELPVDEIEINSSKACTEILKQSGDASRWRDEFGRSLRNFLGMSLWLVLFDDPDQTWDTLRLKKHGREERFYWVTDE